MKQRFIMRPLVFPFCFCTNKMRRRRNPDLVRPAIRIQSNTFWLIFQRCLCPVSSGVKRMCLHLRVLCVHEAGCGKFKWALARSLSLSGQCPFFYGSQISPPCIPLAHKQIPAVSTFVTGTPPNKSLQEWCSGVVSNNRMTLLWWLWRANTDKHLHLLL